MNKNLLRLAKAILRLASAETDKGILTYEGELEVGTEVFVEDENGELVAAADGDYLMGEMLIVVAEGKVAELKESEKPEEPAEEEPVVEEPMAEEEPVAEEPAVEEDEKDSKIAELEARVKELEEMIEGKDAEIAELKSKADEQEEMLKKSVEKFAAEMENKTKKTDKYATMAKYLK